MRFFVRFLAELGAPWSSELLDTLANTTNFSLGSERTFFLLPGFFSNEELYYLFSNHILEQ